MHLGKAYTATMRLGERTASHDAETEVEKRVDASGVTRRDVDETLQSFVGEIKQVPPMYSAVKIEGERLYKKARRGETVDRPPRIVSIYDLDVTGMDGTDVHFRMECSKGTYVRSLARDVGEALGVGAHLTALRREAIGEYHVDDAWTPDRLEAALTS
jgi:tRNA pseudouridine55 synthase